MTYVEYESDHVSDYRDRRTIVRENRQLKGQNKYLAKEKEEAERREKGERLLNVGYAVKEGGAEKMSRLHD